MAKRNTPVLEPTTQAFIDALAAQGGKPLYELSYADARKVLEDAQAIDVKKLPADIEEKVFPVGRLARCLFGFIARLVSKLFYLL